MSQESKKAIKDLVRVDLNKNQTQAIESFVEHLGVNVFKNSTLLKVLNKNDFDLVPQELARWIKTNGKVSEEMVEQRQVEIDLFTKQP